MDVRLFGGVTLVGDSGVSVPLGRGRGAMIVALLALRPGETLSIDRLVDEVWPRDPPSRPTHAVRVVVSRVRAALRAAGVGDGIICADTGGYVLRAQRTDVDLLRFRDLVGEARHTPDPRERLRLADEARAMCVGEPLAGLEAMDMAAAWRRDAAQWHADMLEAWATAAIELGRPDDVVDAIGPALDDLPYRERLWACHAEALYRVGRQREAMQSLARARTTLAEAGLDVSPELVAVERRILDRSGDPISSGVVPPRPVDRFVGRDDELAALVEIVGRARLVTLTGPGGVGKTRLALELADRVAPGFDDIRWADLTGLAVGDNGVEAALSRSLGAARWRPGGFVAAMREAVADRTVLVVVDNCEHVVEAAASAVSGLLASCPTVSVVATSRSQLRIRGEHVVAVGPLQVGLDTDGSTDARAGEAVELFSVRARAADRYFRLDPTRFDDVCRIVRRLDGVPLAIELAAAMTATTTITDVRARIERDVLASETRPRRDGHRQATMTATVGWSYRLLDEPAQRLLRRLAVFPGAFHRDDAAAVGECRVDGPAVLDGLVDASMVDRTWPAGHYRLLSPIREFALTALRDDGEETDALDARDRAMVDLLTAAGRSRELVGDHTWRERIGSSTPSVRATIHRLLELGRRTEAMETASVLVWFLGSLGRYPEAAEVASNVLEGAGPTRSGAAVRLFESALWTAMWRGDYPTARRLSEEIGRMPLDRTELDKAVGALHTELGDLRLGRRFTRAALAGLSSPSKAVLVNLAAIEAWSGNIDDAIAVLDDLAGVGEARPDVDAIAEVVRAIVARMGGRPAESIRLIECNRVAIERHASRFHAVLATLEHAVALREVGEWASARQVCDHLLADDDLPLYTRFRAEVLLIGLTTQIDGWSDRVDRRIRSVVDEAAVVGALWPLAEIADLTALRVLTAGDQELASRIAAAGTTARAALGLARDPWEERRMLPLSDPRSTADAVGNESADIAALIEVVRSALRCPASH